MKFIDLLKMCCNNLFRRKLRTSLTLIGIIIGALSVCMTLSIGNAIKSNNKKITESKGDLKVIKVSVDENVNRLKKDKEKLYMDDNALNMLRSIDGVDGIWVKLNLPWQIDILAGKNNKYDFDGFSSDVIGVYMEDVDKFGYEVLSGTKPTQKYISDKGQVQVLSGQYFEYGFRKIKSKNWKKSTRQFNSPSEKYYHDKNSNSKKFILKKPFVTYGKDEMKISIKLPEEKNNMDDVFIDNLTGLVDNNEEVILKDKYKSYDLDVTGRLNWGKVKDDDYRLRNDAAYSIFIDIDLAKQIIKEYRRLYHLSTIYSDVAKKSPLFTYNDVKVKVKDIDLIQEVSSKVHKMGFKPTDKLKDVEKEQAKTKSDQMVLGFLGMVTLFVASLSVANTMVTSMYERTTEIGIMKVLGCKIGNIQILFLLESAILGLIGGTIGIALSYGLSTFMNNITNVANQEELTGIAQLLSTYMSMMKYDSYSDIKLNIALITPKLCLYVIIGAIVVTIIAGYFPSRKASKISALKAIKDE